MFLLLSLKRTRMMEAFLFSTHSIRGSLPLWTFPGIDQPPVSLQLLLGVPILSSAFSLQVLRLFIWMFVPPVRSWQRRYGSVGSPRFLLIGEETLVFSISAYLWVIGSLPALVVWPEVILETGAGRVEGNPVRSHSFRSISPSAAFHRNWSVSSVLEAATWGTNFIFASFLLHVITMNLMVFVLLFCS